MRFTPKILACALAATFAASAATAAQPDRYSTENSAARATSKTARNTMSVGLPKAVADEARKLMPIDPQYVLDNFYLSKSSHTVFQRLHDDLIAASNGSAGYIESRLKELQAAGTPAAKRLAPIYKACKTEQCATELAYRDKYVMLLLPSLFDNKRLGLAETKLMNWRYINDARFAPLATHSIYYLEASNRLLSAVAGTGKLPANGATVAPAMLEALYRMPFATFEGLTRMHIGFGNKDAFLNGEPSSPIQYSVASTGRTYKWDTDGVSAQGYGGEFFGPKHINGRELTITIEGSQSDTDTATKAW